MPPATGIARLPHARSTRRHRSSGRLSTDARRDVTRLGFAVGTALDKEIHGIMAEKAGPQAAASFTFWSISFAADRLLP
jgi:hypothetical protein